MPKLEINIGRSTLDDLFKNKSAYGGTGAPFDSKYYGKEISYYTGLCPAAEEVLKTSVRIPVSEFYSEQDLNDTINALKKVSTYFNNHQG